MVKSAYQIRIINRVKSLREEHHLNQKELAKALHVSPGQIGNVESESFPQKYTLPQLQAIAKYFNFKMETLFMNKNESNITTEECLDRICRYIKGE